VLLVQPFAKLSIVILQVSTREQPVGSHSIVVVIEAPFSASIE
jgi:hypothetical protein